MDGGSNIGRQRFRRIGRQSSSIKLDQLLHEDLEGCPHIKELFACYTSDWVSDENKYGRYESITLPSFPKQVFEGPDIQTEMLSTKSRLTKLEDITHYGVTNSSGRFSVNSKSYDVYNSDTNKHFGSSPLPAYEPSFDWEHERSLVFGQRTPASPVVHYGSGLKISVKVLSLSLQAGLAEPFFGTICLYNKERREKLSEDFYFHVFPTDVQDGEGKHLDEPRGIFYLDAGSASVCLLVQLEKSATEENNVNSIYSRKDLGQLSEREGQDLFLWSRMIPYREPFAWTMVSLFDNIGMTSPGSASPSTTLARSVSGSSCHEWAVENISNLTLGGKVDFSRGSSVVVEISNLHRVKESYSEDSLLDPRFDHNKRVNGTLCLEIEHLFEGVGSAHVLERSSSKTNSAVPGEMLGSASFKFHVNAFDGHSTSFSGLKQNKLNKKGISEEAARETFIVNDVNDIQVFDFRTSLRNEPFLQPFHFLYVYPLTSLSRKRNLFIRVELWKSDTDKQPLEAVLSRESGVSLQKWAHTQVASHGKVACYHDEIKVLLPAVWTQMHHILFTFLHIDLQSKMEASKPVVVGYAVLPLSTHAQLKTEVSLPVMKELVPNYLQNIGKEWLNYWEDGKHIFKLRLRLCSSLFPTNERVRDFFVEYDRHTLQASAPWGSELLDAINCLKNADSTTLLQFLHPILKLLLSLIGNGGETFQVAAFRVMVNILVRVQQEVVDDERNRFLAHFVDFAFDDLGGRQPPVYPGLSTVWGSLARSKAKGYRVGPIYDDVLSMAWFFLELITKSMALQQIQLFNERHSLGDDILPLQLSEGVFRCITHLFDCLITEVLEHCKKGSSLGRCLNSCLAFFCYDLLSIIEPHQVFELVSLYLEKFPGVCLSILHECKLSFLQIICDHDLYVEMPGKYPSERNSLSLVLIQELFISWDHSDVSLQLKAARFLVVLACKHMFDVRYQKPEDKLYIAQQYLPLVEQILDEMPVFYNLNVVAKREVLIVILQCLRNLDDVSLRAIWQQNIARTRLFFKLMEECLVLFEKFDDEMPIDSSSHNAVGIGSSSPKYSDRLSPAVNSYLSEASRQEIKRVNSQRSSPGHPYSLREALAQAQSSRIETSTQVLRGSLHPLLRKRLELWEENLSVAVSLEVLEITGKFSIMAASHGIATDFGKLDCITAIFMGFFSRNQPVNFWKALLPVFNDIFELHGTTLMARENDRFLKQIAFHLLRLGIFRNENIRQTAVIGLQIIIKISFRYSAQMARLRVMLTITLSELLSDVPLTQMKPNGTLGESDEAQRLRQSLQELSDELKSQDLLRQCGLTKNTLLRNVDSPLESRWSWPEVKYLSDCLILVLDASIEHAAMGSMMSMDRYVAAESFCKLAMAFESVPDLHVMWLLHLCDAHQEMQSWAEAAQCAVAVAGNIMQALVARKEGVWSNDHLSALRKICPMASKEITWETSAAEVEGYGASKLTVDSAVKYLQLANKLFSQAELHHFCADILELVIPVYKSRRAYGHLAKCHTLLTDIYDSIVEQESSPIPITDATYYRVGFYGEAFGKLDRKEYVYREPRDVRLGDIMQKISHIYESRMEGEKLGLQVIPDSRQVKAEELQPGLCYLQITAVDPVMENEDLGSRRERLSSPGRSIRTRVFDRFLFDTPFTKNGNSRSQGGLEDQWKRRTVVQTGGSFPAMVNRLLVIKSECIEFSPVENAIGMIETRTSTLRNELEEPRSSDGDQLRRLQSLQRILQGSVAVQVNSGVLSVCTAFLSGEPATRLRSQELQQLIAALLEFMAVCKRAVRVHFRLIGDDDQDFHTQLVNGFQSLTAELSHYIPAILSEL